VLPRHTALGSGMSVRFPTDRAGTVPGEPL
jgi:hypothetical protein